MKNQFIKLARLTLFLGALILFQDAKGQVDPELSAFQISPNPIPRHSINSIAQVTYGMSGTGSVIATGIVIQISFPVDYVPYPLAAPTMTSDQGKFTFSYNQALRTVTATSNEELSAGEGDIIRITLTGVNETSSSPLSVAQFQNTVVISGDDINNNRQETSANVSAAPNPVSLISFNAQKEAQTAVLSWSTAEEINSDRFEVEHSLNGKNWQMIGSVAARGNSNITEWYSFTDINPANGSNLYRLRMVDRDGTFEITRAKSLEFDITIETALYPNPVVDRLLLKSEDLSQIRRVELYNASGKSVLESETVPASGIDVKALPTGFYVIRITRSNGSTDTFKVLKQ